MTNTALEKIFAQIKKSYGDNAVYHLSEIPAYDVVSTGSLSLDYALGIGGYPLGRVIEIAGAEGTGKTTGVLHALNNYLKQFPDRGVGFIDMEHRLETDWAENFIDEPDRMIVVKPSDAEEGVNIYRDLAKSGQVSAIAWDSIGGSPTAKGLEKDANTREFAGNSGIITQFAKYATTLSGKFNFTTIGINQIREDMSGYQRHMTPGGRAWKHACSLRLQVKRGPKGKDGEVFQKINGEDMLVGYQVHVKVIKSSVGAPGRIATYWFYNVKNDLGFGIDQIEEVARLSVLTEVVERRGAWLYHELLPDGKIMGNAAFSAFLKENIEARTKLFDLTMAKMKSGTVDMSEIVPMSADPEQSLEEFNTGLGGAKSLAEIRAKLSNGG